VTDPHAIALVDQVGRLAHLAGVAEQARDYVAAAKAPNTLRAYRADWRDFAGWCGQHRLEALPHRVLDPPGSGPDGGPPA
jgi:hypothetical protein